MHVCEREEAKEIEKERSRQRETEQEKMDEKLMRGTHKKVD